MEQKSSEWLPIWSRDHHDMEQTMSLFNEVQQAALQQEPIQIDVATLSSHLGRVRGTRAMGFDGLSNQDLKDCPPASRDALCELINDIIRHPLHPGNGF